MAINIDSVYQKILALTNKEQRGYVTPQEFNLLANQAQMEIFEQYFYDVEQWRRRMGNEYEYSDMVTNLEEKFEIFQVWNQALPIQNIGLQTVGTGAVAMLDIGSVFSELYQLGDINVRYNQQNQLNFVKAEKISPSEVHIYEKSALTKGNFKRPNFISFSGSIGFFPEITDTDEVRISYIRKPRIVSWGYVVVRGKALFDPDPNKTVHFELHAAEEVELVYKILRLAGVTIQRNEIIQMGQGMETSQIQQEKQ